VALIYLLATGLPLQFTSSLDLGNRFVTAPAILDWYLLEAPQTVMFDQGVGWIGERAYWQAQELGEITTFLGALNTGELMVIGTRHALLVFSPENPGQLERIDFAQPLQAIASYQNRVVLRSGTEVLQLDPLLLNASTIPIDPAQIAWRTPRQLTAAEAQPYRQAYRHKLLSVERLLQDLHSGRAFGQPGIWIINLATLLLAGLAITGYWIWWRSRGR